MGGRGVWADERVEALGTRSAPAASWPQVAGIARLPRTDSKRCQLEYKGDLRRFASQQDSTPLDAARQHGHTEVEVELQIAGGAVVLV